jgi:hypothetical protein
MILGSSFGLSWNLILPAPTNDWGDFPMRATSWTGSELQRHPQGTCSSNGYKTPEVHRFEIPTGTKVEIKKIADGDKWIKFQTTKSLGFARYECREGGWLIFREQGWWLRVKGWRIYK